MVSCTGGERGDVLNPHFEQRPVGLDQIRAVREVEMAAAASALGVRHRWLGFVDSGLPEGDPLPPLPEGSFAAMDLAEAAAPLVALVRELRPHVMTTYDPLGGYPHPDHIRCHQVAVEAFRLAGDPAALPGIGKPWKPLKLYYNHDFSMRRVRTLHEAMLKAGLESPYGAWVESREAREIPERPVTTQVRVDAYAPQRDAALRAHASQVDPQGFFFAVPRDLERQVWPWEEFELAASRVAVALPEDDLFAGIDGAASDAVLQAAADLEVPVAGDDDVTSDTTIAEDK